MFLHAHDVLRGQGLWPELGTFAFGGRPKYFWCNFSVFDELPDRISNKASRNCELYRNIFVIIIEI